MQHCRTVDQAPLSLACRTQFNDPCVEMPCMLNHTNPLFR